jgi:hypothetical protein
MPFPAHGNYQGEPSVPGFPEVSVKIGGGEFRRLVIPQKEMPASGGFGSFAAEPR